MKTTSSFACLFLAVCLSTSFGQGLLTPPGSPAPTMKTLDQLDAKLEKRTPISSLPYNLNTSGSYYLTTNLLTTAGYISVNANNVTIDLNGFTMDGLTTGSFGIVVFSGNNLTVRNGVIRGINGGGVGVDGRSIACHFENVQEINDAGTGFWCGPGSSFVNCGFYGNQDQAIVGDVGTLVKNCIFVSNGIPFSVGTGSLITGCTFFTNTGSLQLDPGVTVSDCSLVGNTTTHISGSDGDQILNCLIRYGAFSGISLNNGCTVKNCIIEKNAQTGITCGNHCVIEDNQVVSNSFDGISAGSASVILNNLASANGIGNTTVAGIHTSGNGSRIEANQTRNNGGYGIRSDGGAGADVIIRNTAGANGFLNYQPSTGATFGTIQNPSSMTNTLGNIVF